MSTAARRSTPDDPASAHALSNKLGVELGTELAVLALTHRSYAYENGGLPTNERLEFLGDSVLGVVITERLYRDHPDLPEGQLAKLRASIVNMHALAGVAREIDLGSLIRLGNGEELTGGRDKPSILADAVEAMIGASYLQHGLEVTREAIHRLFATLITTAPQLGAGLDWKTSLQELAAIVGGGVPVYQVAEDGPDHAKTFAATVLVGDREVGAGRGRTKKEAEQQAASIAYTTLQAEQRAAEGTDGESAEGDRESGGNDVTGDAPAAEPPDSASGVPAADPAD